jgi:hypothetical protein
MYPQTMGGTANHPFVLRLALIRDPIRLNQPEVEWGGGAPGSWGFATSSAPTEQASPASPFECGDLILEFRDARRPVLESGTPSSEVAFG